MIRIIHLFVVLLVPAVCAAADDWAVGGAPYRVRLEAAVGPGIPEAGYEIRLTDFGSGRADMRDVVLLDADGREIGLDPVWRGAGRTLLLLAESMPGDGTAAMLYFGGDSARRMKSWNARRSLLLETRRLPAGGNPGKFGGWQEAWRKARVVDGAAFVPMIFHGGNPFGESHHFLSRYTGVLKTGDGGELRFYTLSDDVSYVGIAGRPVLEWRKDHPPPLDPGKVPVAKVRVPKGLADVGYCHAAVDPPGAMVLGWEQGGKLGTIPPEAWVHPGKVVAGGIESADGAPVPLGAVEALRYLGYGGQWYVEVRCALPDPGDGWQVEWLWQDGRVDRGPEAARLWMSLEPARVVVRLRKGGRTIEGRRVLVIPRELEAASVNQERQLARFLGLLEKEDPAQLGDSERRAGFVLARAFLPSSSAATWAEAWLAVAKPEGGAWVEAVDVAIRDLAKRDPKAALERLAGLAAEERAAMGREAGLLELDLRVFALKDPQVTGLVARLETSGDMPLARMATIRLGDYHLLNGRLEDAVRCFTKVAGDLGKDAGRGAVIDRSHSLAIEELVAGGHLDEARAKLDAWERQRPMAKMDGDQLMWRARVMFLAGDHGRALQDLETSLRVRPGSPEEIDVLFWQGRALYELGRKEEARRVWTSLVNDYPKHERAEEAKQWAQKS